MKKKEIKTRKITFILLVLSLIVSTVLFPLDSVHAAGWLDYAQQTITLGTAVHNSIKAGDYRGKTENGYTNYWHIYKFSMPKDGLLNVYLESEISSYFSRNSDGAGFAIFPASNPDDRVWHSNTITATFSASRAMYCGSAEISLKQGEYYFTVRQYNTYDTPYYLTLSYKEPVINVTSISLNPTSMTMEIGNQATIDAVVLPDNATDKTIVWESADSSIATVDNGIVKAISVGTVAITAKSLDGEISARCMVTVRCSHIYQSSLTQADTNNDGYIARTCTRCGLENKDIIPGIDKIELSKISYDYDGSEHKPSVTVMDKSGNTLEKGRDYEVVYPDNTQNIGTYTVTIQFIGNYKGTADKSYVVSPVPVKSVSLVPSDITLKTGAQQQIQAVILPSNATNKELLWKSTNPSVATVSNGTIKAVSVGTTSIIATTIKGEETATCTVNVICSHDYHITLTAAGRNSNGSLVEECTQCGNIKQNTLIYAINNIGLSKTSYVYNGKVQMPSVIVKDTSGRNLVKDTDYTISYTGNQKDVGIHTITIKFIGNYEGIVTKEFTIYPKPTKITKIKSQKRGFMLTWNKQISQNTGYEIAYATNEKFDRKNTKIITINKNETTQNVVSKLKSQKKYYVRIRTYKNIKVNEQNTRLYSGWSKVKTVYTKK